MRAGLGGVGRWYWRGVRSWGLRGRDLRWELEGLGFDSLIGESWTKRGRQMDLWRGLGGRRQEHERHWPLGDGGAGR